MSDLKLAGAIVVLATQANELADRTGHAAAAIYYRQLPPRSGIRQRFDHERVASDPRRERDSDRQQLPFRHVVLFVNKCWVRPRASRPGGIVTRRFVPSILGVKEGRRSIASIGEGPSAGGSLAESHQNTNFRPICNSRIGFLVLVIEPYSGLVNVVFGSFQIGLFNTLNASRRNCRVLLRISRKFRMIDASTLRMPGPKKV